MIEIIYLEEPLVSKYKVDCCLADGECEDPFLVVIPELGIDHVELKLQSLALNKVSVGQRGRGLGVHQGPVQLAGVPVLALQHPRDAHVKETARRNVHVNSSSFLLFGK